MEVQRLREGLEREWTYVLEEETIEQGRCLLLAILLINAVDLCD